MGNPDFSVVLVRLGLSANLGSAARASKNFGVSDLRLVEPAAGVDEEAYRLASGADDVLETVRRYESLPAAVAEFGAVVATSSLRGRGVHHPLSLAELPDFIGGLSGAPVAFVFGPERSGLTEEEMSCASVSLRLPTEEGFPTMNVSHAVAVTLAAARLAAPSRGEPEALAPAGDVEGMIGHWDRALEAIGFYDTGHRDRTLRDWKRMIAGRPLSERDVAMLRGVANRVLVSLRRNKS